jgi:hypothetical protein
MERATSKPMAAVVSARDDGMPRNSSLRRALRGAVVASALVAGIACAVVLSSGGLSAGARGAGPVELDEPTFGSSKLTPFPKEEPSTDDLIAIMRGKGTGDVNADQALLFAGGAGGKIRRSIDVWETGQPGNKPELTPGSAQKEARGLWEAAERASKLESRARRAHGKHSDDEHLDDMADIEDDAVDEAASGAPALAHAAKKVAAGWTANDEMHKSNLLAHSGSHAAGSEKAEAKAAGKARKAAYKSESRVSILNKIEKAGKEVAAEHAAAAAKQKPTLAKTPARAHAAQGAARAAGTAHAAHQASSSEAKDGYFKHHLSMDDALAHLAKIRAEHEAAESAKSFKAKMDALHKKERAEEQSEHHKAVAEAVRAKAMEAKAVKAAKQAEADEARAKYEAEKEQQQLALKHQEEKSLKLAKSQLAHVKTVDAGWTAADAKRAAFLAKKFSRKPVQALNIYEGASPHAKSAEADAGRTSHDAKDAKAAGKSSWHPTGFIPSKEQHDDAHSPDAMPEMVAGIHAKHQERAQDPLSAEARRLDRASQMRQDERVEEAQRKADLKKQRQLESKGREIDRRTKEVRAGEHLVDKLASAAEAARVMEKVDLSGIAVAPSLKAAVVGDIQQYLSFEHGDWMRECAGSKSRLAPVAKQVLNVMEQINTQNASAWLDVEDAQRHADKAKAELRAAESALVAVLENEDRTKAVMLLEQMRKDRARHAAERRAAAVSAADKKQDANKVSLLLQQRQALKVLSHSEEAEALSGDARRVQLNKAADEAQAAVTRENRHAAERSSQADYVKNFEGSMLETASRPWSLSAQEGVQTLLGDINAKILAIEHTEKSRKKGLEQLEAKVLHHARPATHAGASVCCAARLPSPACCRAACNGACSVALLCCVAAS